MRALCQPPHGGEDGVAGRPTLSSVPATSTPAKPCSQAGIDAAYTLPAPFAAAQPSALLASVRTTLARRVWHSADASLRDFQRRARRRRPPHQRPGPCLWREGQPCLRCGGARCGASSRHSARHSSARAVRSADPRQVHDKCRLSAVSRCIVGRRCAVPCASIPRRSFGAGPILPPPRCMELSSLVSSTHCPPGVRGLDRQAG